MEIKSKEKVHTLQQKILTERRFSSEHPNPDLELSGKMIYDHPVYLAETFVDLSL